MAKAEFKWKKGAGRELLSTPHIYKAIDKKCKSIEAKANSMAQSSHGGDDPYMSRTVYDRKTGMARGFVGTANAYGAKNNGKHNTLLKSMNGG